MFVCCLYNSKITQPNFINLLCMLPVAVVAPLTALLCVMYFRFCRWCHFSYNGQWLVKLKRR